MRLDSIILQSVQQLKCGVLYDDVQEMRNAGIEQLDQGMMKISKCILFFILVPPGRQFKNPLFWRNSLLLKQPLQHFFFVLPNQSVMWVFWVWFVFCLVGFWFFFLNQMHGKNLINLGIVRLNCSNNGDWFCITCIMLLSFVTLSWNNRTQG